MEPQVPSLGPKLRLLCSYGGRITPIPPSNTLEYIGGETRIVAVPRDISFSSFFQLLSGKLLYGRTFSLKYRLPGCDLDSLITVNDNEDLQNMIAEYDSASYYQRIRLFLFPLNYSESSTRHPLSANLLGLESPIQKIIYTSSSSVAPFPIFSQSNDTGVKRVDHGKIHATSDEEPITLTSLELNTAADTGGSDKETERAENQDQTRRIVVQEPFQQQQFLPIIYLPVLPMQPHMVTRSVNGYALSPAIGIDPVLENKENPT